MPNQYVNDQIVESVANVVTLNVGQAPSQSSAMLDVAMAETIGMTMYNAVSRQQSSSTVGSAAVTTACAKMLQTPFPPANRRHKPGSTRRVLPLRPSATLYWPKLPPQRSTGARLPRGRPHSNRTSPRPRN